MPSETSDPPTPKEIRHFTTHGPGSTDFGSGPILGLIFDALAKYPYALRYIKGLRELCYDAADRIQGLEEKLHLQREHYRESTLRIRNRLANAVDLADHWAGRYETELNRRKIVTKAARKLANLFDGNGNLIGDPEPAVDALRDALKEIEEHGPPGS